MDLSFDMSIKFKIKGGKKKKKSHKGSQTWISTISDAIQAIVAYLTYLR